MYLKYNRYLIHDTQLKKERKRKRQERERGRERSRVGATILATFLIKTMEYFNIKLRLLIRET